MSDPVKVRCRCPYCGHGRMVLAECALEQNAGLGFHCRGCGGEWMVEEIREIADDYAAALAVADRADGDRIEAEKSDAIEKFAQFGIKATGGGVLGAITLHVASAEKVLRLLRTLAAMGDKSP